MPDEKVKISQLPSATELEDTDVVAGVSGGITSKIYLSVLAAFIAAGIDPEDMGAVPDTRTVNGYALSTNITLDAEDVGAAPEIQLGSVALSGSWSGAGPYSQTVTVTGATVTENSRVDIQLTAAQIAALIAAGVTGLVIENTAGTLTAWAVGASPSGMTVQVTVTEVAA